MSVEDQISSQAFKVFFDGTYVVLKLAGKGASYATLAIAGAIKKNSEIKKSGGKPGKTVNVTDMMKTGTPFRVYQLPYELQEKLKKDLPNAAKKFGVAYQMEVMKPISKNSKDGSIALFVPESQGRRLDAALKSIGVGEFSVTNASTEPVPANEAPIAPDMPDSGDVMMQPIDPPSFVSEEKPNEEIQEIPAKELEGTVNEKHAKEKEADAAPVQPDKGGTSKDRDVESPNGGSGKVKTKKEPIDEKNLPTSAGRNRENPSGRKLTTSGKKLTADSSVPEATMSSAGVASRAANAALSKAKRAAEKTADAAKSAVKSIDKADEFGLDV